MEELVLIKANLEYKEQALAFLEEVRAVDAGTPWEYAGMSSLEKYPNNYEEWITLVEDYANGVNLPEGYVPGTTYFLIRTSDNRLVGICNIRHELNEVLLKHGGHVGQTVRPSERGKGYGVKQIEMAVAKLLELGVEDVLITCHKENIPSAKSIEKCLGVLENEITLENGEVLKRYWIKSRELARKRSL